MIFCRMSPSPDLLEDILPFARKSQPCRWARGSGGVVHVLADGGELRAGVELRPAGVHRHPEDVAGEVFVFILGIRAGEVALARDELGVVVVEGVRDVFEEDEAEDDVLVFRRVHVVAQLVGGEPELGLEAGIGGGVFRSVEFGAGHLKKR